MSHSTGNIPRTGARRWRTDILPIAAVALVAVVLAAAAWFAIANRETYEAQKDFNALAHNHALILQNGVENCIDDIEAVRALFESSDRGVTRAEFEQFTEEILSDQNAILSMAWIPFVKRNERARHEQAATADDMRDYRIRAVTANGTLAIAPEQNEYFPVYYRVEKEPAGEAYVYGVDQGDGGARQKALERARDRDQLTVSDDVLLRSGGGTRHGFLAVMPVYRKGMPHDTIETRRTNLIGFVRGVFETSAMIESILNANTTPQGLDLYFYDAGAGPNTPPVYFHPSRVRSSAPPPISRAQVGAGFHWTGKITVGDREFVLVAVPTPGGPAIAEHTRAWMVFTGILLLGAAAMAYLWSSRRHARNLELTNEQLDKTLDELGVATDELLLRNVRFDAALNNMLQGLVMFDGDEQIVVCNDRYLDMYGLPRDIVKPGCSLQTLIRLLADSGQFQEDPAQYRAEMLAGLAKGRRVTTLKTSDGREVLVSSVPMAEGGWVATFEDVTERRQAAAKIAHMAMHDALTNLPNRLFFRQKLEDCIAHLARDEGFAVLCLDLDHFKSVNDTLGHPFGDKLLRQASGRLLGCLRDGDSLARLGGDEFAILQSNVIEPTDAIALMARLIEVVGQPYDLDGHQVVVGVSIGIALAPTDSMDPDQLLKSADMALYRAKVDGRGVYRFFEAEMDARMQARRTLELDIRRALVNREFELYYQPIVSLETEAITAFEALIRWHHPTRGLIMPADFIPLAEETALIVPIGEWVLQQACDEAAKWPLDVRIAVNLSPAQFKTPSLSQTIIKALANSGLAAHRLELEITESVLLFNSEATLATLHHLRSLGVRISMDDFGTGYSSLSYLRSFPFDKIKIDQSFVHNLSMSEDSQAIIRAVAGLGTSLRMSTTGEGVETQEELDYLRKEGCTEAQGFFFSKPRPAQDVAEILAEHAAKNKAFPTN